MSIIRANKYLNEILEILDMHRSKYRAGDIGDDEARASLSSADNEWIDGECYHSLIDTRYFLSNYYAIRTEDKGFQGLYPFFDSQEILYEELRKLEKEHGRVRALIAKARRMGYTTYMVGEFLHKAVIRFKHTDSIIVSQDEKGAKYNMGMFESAFDFLPWWMKPRVNLHQTGALYNFDEPDENLRTSRPGLKNWVYADNANRPSGVGRGQGFRCGMLDELAFWKNASQLSKSLLRTFVARDGFYVMGSTGNGRNDAWHNLWRRAEAGSIDWNPIFIPFYRRPKTYSLPIPKGEQFELTPEEQEMVDQVKEKKGVIISKETINWVRKTKEEFIATDGDDMLFDQEYPVVAEASFQNAIISAIPRGIINRYSKRTAEPRWVGEISFDFGKWIPQLFMKELKPGEEALYPETENRLHVWEKAKPGEKYCIGVDVALGQKGGDYSSCTVMKISANAQLDEQVAQWHGYMDPHNLADIVLALCWYYNEALLAVEVNSFGMATNTRLLREYEYENIYRFKRMDRLKHFMTDIVGFWTDYKSKRTLISFCSKMMLDDQVIIRDKYLIDEMRDFTEDGAEGEGAHDDYCFVPDTLIRTERGMVRIDSVKVGDAVLSHDGLWRMVESVGHREVKEEICVIRPFGSTRSIRCTGEHPMFIKKRRGSSPVRLMDESWVAARGVEKGDVVYHPVAPNLQPPPLSDDELYLLGWCLADGYAGKQVTVGFGKDERLCAEYIQHVMQNIVNRHPTTWGAGVGCKGVRTKESVVSLKDEGNFFSVVVGNKWLASWIRYWVGKPGKKKIHELILRGEGTIPFVVGFLEGDGSQKGTRRGAINVTQKNRQILLDIQDMLRRHGVWCGIGPKDNKDGNPILSIGAPWVGKMLGIFPGLLYERAPKGLDHPIARWDGRGFWVTIAKVEREFYAGKVYNLAVSNSHSYTAEGFAVHNCMSFMIALYCGHEGEFEERRQKPAAAKPDQNTYVVYKMQSLDGMQIPVKQYVSNSPFEAERFSKRMIGSYIVNEHGAMADLKMRTKAGDKIIRVPADFQNTAYSPIHDKPGTRQRMFDEGVPAEMIDSQSALEFDARQEDEDMVSDSESWKWS